MANIYVIDTSALISNPDVVRIPRRHWVIIPAVVLRQLDGLKNSSDSNTAYWARKASQAIEQQQRKGNLLIEGSSLDVNALDNKADNEIIGAALWARRNYVAKNVILVSTDRNMRIAAVNCGLGAEEGNGSLKGRIWAGVFWVAITIFILNVVYNIFVLNNIFPKNKHNDDSVYLTIFVCSLFLSSISAVFATVFGNRSSSKSKQYDDDDDDILLDPGCASIPGNINHHYYKR